MELFTSGHTANKEPYRLIYLPPRLRQRETERERERERERDREREREGRERKGKEEEKKRDTVRIAHSQRSLVTQGSIARTRRPLEICCTWHLYREEIHENPRESRDLLRARKRNFRFLLAECCECNSQGDSQYRRS